LLRIVRYLIVACTVGGTVILLTSTQGSAGRLFADGYLGNAAPGQTVNISGSGFADNSTVTLTLQSNPIFLATVETNSSGSFSTSVTIPVGVPLGNHDIVATGVDAHGVALVQKTLVNVENATTAASPTSTPLASTGLRTQLLLAGALVALLVGGAAVRGGRRRKAADEDERVGV
jgi:hypothetical protein